MSSPSHILYVALIILVVVMTFSYSLRCYNCYDSTNDSDCQDAGLLSSAWVRLNEVEHRGKIPHYGLIENFKECDPNQTMCVVETYKFSNAKTYLSYIRDCSDGELFSYTDTSIIENQLKLSGPDNQTHCIYSVLGNLHICITLCNTAICNGPQLPVDCEKKANENNTVCGASTLSHFLSQDSLGMVGGLFGYPLFVQFFFFYFLLFVIAV